MAGVLVAPDSFKGTFSSVVVAAALAEGDADLGHVEGAVGGAGEGE